MQQVLPSHDLIPQGNDGRHCRQVEWRPMLPREGACLSALAV